MEQALQHLQNGGHGASNELSNYIFGNSSTAAGIDTIYKADTVLTPRRLLLYGILVLLCVCTVLLWRKWRSEQKQAYDPNPYVGRR